MPLPESVHKILVVDDDEVMRELLHALLSVEGYGLVLAGSGPEAVQLLRAGAEVDLVLTDLHMPGLESEALAEALRETLPEGALLIGMSGSEPPAGTRAGFDAFLLKPFDAPAFATALQVAQDRHEALPAATEANQASPILASLAAAATDFPPPLDETIFAALSKTIPAQQLGQLYSMTLADVAKRQAHMEAAAAAGDTATVRREAHAIKGSCGFVGATELQGIASALETGTSASTSALAEIPAACLRLRSMLKSKFPSV